MKSLTITDRINMLRLCGLSLLPLAAGGTFAVSFVREYAAFL